MKTENNLQKEKTIIFDFDGTLANSFDYFVDFFHEEILRLGYTIEKKDLYFMIQNKHLSEIFKEYNLSTFKIFMLIRKLRKDFNQKLEEVKFFKGIVDLLFELSEKYNLMLLSSNNQKNIMYLLEKKNIEILFDEMFFKSSLFGKDKSLKKILNKYKFNKQDVIYIGDELRDFEACRKINLRCINVAWGFNSYKLLSSENQSDVVKTIDELKEKLLK